VKIRKIRWGTFGKNSFTAAPSPHLDRAVEKSAFDFLSTASDDSSGRWRRSRWASYHCSGGALSRTARCLQDAAKPAPYFVFKFRWRWELGTVTKGQVEPNNDCRCCLADDSAVETACLAGLRPLFCFSVVGGGDFWVESGCSFLAGLKVRVDEEEELDGLAAGGLVGFCADLAFVFLGGSTELKDESDPGVPFISDVFGVVAFLGFGFLGEVFFMRVAFGFLEPGDNLGGEVLGGSFFFRWGEGFLFF
jgi:hypothetical protein